VVETSSHAAIYGQVSSGFSVQSGSGPCVYAVLCIRSSRKM